MNAKLGDFGLARRLMPGESLHGACGTPNFFSPELKFHGRGNSPKSDIWALGCIIYEMCVTKWANGKTGYVGHARRFSSSSLMSYSKPLRDFIGSCWHMDPGQRPDSLTLMEDRTMMLMHSLTEGRDKELRRLFDQTLAQHRIKVEKELEDLWNTKAAKKIKEEVEWQYQEKVVDLKSKYEKSVGDQVDHTLRKLLQLVNRPSMAQPSLALDQTREASKLLAAVSVRFQGQMSENLIDWLVRLTRVASRSKM